MHYQTAKSELQSPPSGMSLWIMLSEAVVLLVLGFALAQLIGG
jgi:hypothetical protein